MIRGNGKARNGVGSEWRSLEFAAGIIPGFYIRYIRDKLDLAGTTGKAGNCQTKLGLELELVREAYGIFTS
jgi:hypothetical protein